ncbi:hypothetical protein ACR79S_15895 [Sphingobacterium spiritivorum]|uniref:hypothetical protein n=1 Tax=Sphingobacterium spiritivorum TaxID=258 RepID=UPI003DA25F87
MIRRNIMIAIALFVFASCQKTTLEREKNPIDISGNSMKSANVPVAGSVCVAGYEKNSNGKTVAKYWIDGDPINLTNGVFNAVATSITVVNGDVYVAGWEENNNGIPNAKYWINGVSVPLTNGIYFSRAYAITVVGTDVYVAGEEDYTNGNGNFVTAAKYWVNGNEVILPSTSGAQISGMAVFNGNVYISGNDEGSTIPKLWINGISSTLNDPSFNNWSENTGYTTGIVLSDNSVYIAGFYLKPGIGCSQAFPTEKIAVYWKDGECLEVDNSDETGYYGALFTQNFSYIHMSTMGGLLGVFEYSSAQGIAVSNGDVYTVNQVLKNTSDPSTKINGALCPGDLSPDPYHYKYSTKESIYVMKNNDALDRLPSDNYNNERQAEGRGIIVDGADVYVVGNQLGTGPLYLNSNNTSVGIYWKNSIPFVLTDGTREAVANAIVVAK